MPRAGLISQQRLAKHVTALLLGMLCLVAAAPGLAQSDSTRLERYLRDLSPADLVPGADRFGTMRADLPVVPAEKSGTVIGHVFLNSDLVGAVGYSGKPIHVVVGLDTEGTITGAKLVEHHEPIVLIGIPDSRIRPVIEEYVGLNVGALTQGTIADREIDIVSGATVTIMVIDDSIVRAAIKVARALSLGGLTPIMTAASGPTAVVDMQRKDRRDWEGLLGDGSVRKLTLSVGEVNQAFEASGDAEAAARPESGDPDEPFIELYAGLVSVPTIGHSLLGDAEYRNLTDLLAQDQHAILLMGRGRYSFKGSGYVRGGIFDRFQLVQGDRSVRFRDKQHKRLRGLEVRGGPRDLKEVDLFRLPADAEFDPAAPWRIELLVQRAIGPTEKAFLTFDLPYRTPDTYLKPVDPPTQAAATADAATMLAGGERETPLWQTLWRNKVWEIGALAAAISILTVIFFFQNWLARRPKLADTIRLAFLTFTAVGIGFYANAQLSVVNVMTFFNALITEFKWDYFLMEPLIFILWFSVATALLFWGRGAYCGWLCPFGALQELLNRAAKAVKIPQLAVPWGLHERMWPVKYMLFLVLFGMSLYSLELAERLAEVEPFKTAIVLKFARDWPYVAFAVALLAAGLFIERFYCRYLCAVGAAMAIPGRLRMFEWLKRYRECGSPCQRCANDCMVQAIHPEGHINPNECLYCLHCQTLYHDEHRCPVMISKRLKRERRAALASKSMAPNPGSKEPDKELELADFLPG